MILGRPGGPSFYISTIDNTQNHGPGSQGLYEIYIHTTILYHKSYHVLGSKEEADGCFGRVLEGEDVVLRMIHQPGAGTSGFIMDPANNIQIVSLKLIEPIV